MEVQSAFGGVAALVMGDAFRIDDLLDFSNEDIAGPIGDGGLLSNLDSVVTEVETVSNADIAGSLAGTKHLLDGGDDHVTDALCVPCDDLEELEWLSKFVEDSFSMGEPHIRPLTANSGGLSVSTDIHSFESSYNSKDRFHSTSPVSVLESSGSSARVANLLPVPGRARSKRARSGGRVWGNSRILASSSSTTTTDTESLSSDSNVMSGGHYSPSSTLSADSHHPLMFMTPPPKAVTTVKKPWKPSKAGKKGQESAQPWRCLHCQTQRTPQWRAGPMGPKTLCNACGVRYKSGRLVPEYRPAGSPGYIGHKHSNSHKKILEMRRQREQQQQAALQQQQQQQSCMLSSSHVSPHSLLVQHLKELEDDPAGICTSRN